MLSVSRAGFDWRGFGRALRAALAGEGNPPLRRLADNIGVTATDLSRASSGTAVSIEKAFAIADWMGAEPRAFYLPPGDPPPAFGERAPNEINMLHLTPRETARGCATTERQP